MPIATSLSLKEAKEIWSKNTLWCFLDSPARRDPEGAINQGPDFYYLHFSKGKGGRFWSDRAFSFEELEAIYVLGRHATETPHAFEHPDGLEAAREELRFKPNGYFHPLLEGSGIPVFLEKNKHKIDVVGETVLDELEAVLLLCRDQLPTSKAVP